MHFVCLARDSRRLKVGRGLSAQRVYFYRYKMQTTLVEMIDSGTSGYGIAA